MRAQILSLSLICSWLTACAAATTTPTPTPAGNAATAPTVAAPSALTAGDVTFDLAQGQEIGLVYEAFLSPMQEPGEEKDTPDYIPNEFKSTAPSLLRAQRASQGHGIVRFTKDLSRAYVDVQIANINPADINLFHIHCGRPDQLGPILVDLAAAGDLPTQFADNVLSLTVTNAELEAVSHSGHGLVGAFTSGCPIVPGLPDDVKTIAGMAYIAKQGELYFNLHTKGQTYFGDVRGQLYPVTAP